MRPSNSTSIVLNHFTKEHPTAAAPLSECPFHSLTFIRVSWTQSRHVQDNKLHLVYLLFIKGFLIFSRVLWTHSLHISDNKLQLGVPFQSLTFIWVSMSRRRQKQGNSLDLGLFVTQFSVCSLGVIHCNDLIRVKACLISVWIEPKRINEILYV